MAKDYFSHDYNARNDKQLTKLFMKHGLKGIGAYWCIVEMLYEEGGYLKIEEYERITFELRTEYDFIKSIIEDYELFENDDVKFWSNTAIERLNLRAEKSQKARESIEKRWKKYERNTNVKQTNNKRNTIKEKESKEKESKEKVQHVIFDEIYFPKNLDIDNAFKDYLKLRKESKYTMTDRAIKALVKKLREIAGDDAKKALEVIENAILGKWKSFYSENKTYKSNGQTQQNNSKNKLLNAFADRIKTTLGD